MICYLIQCHQLPQQVAWLVSLLQDDDNFFVVSIEGTEAFYAELTDLLKGIDNVRIIRSYPVTWSGMSQVTATLDGFRFAVETCNRWQYIINLSGQCFPLQPQHMIRQFLSESAIQGHKLFMNVVKPKVVAPIRFDNRAQVNALTDISLFNAKRMRCRIHPQLTPYFQTWNDSPVMKAYLRTAMWTTEINIEKTIYVRPLFDYEARYREYRLKHTPHYWGRAWYMCHRSFCEWLIDNDSVDELYNLFSSVFEPDESFFQTLVKSQPHWAASLVEKNYRLNAGTPRIYSDKSALSFNPDDALFGRKLDFQNSPKLIKHIEALCAR